MPVLKPWWHRTTKMVCQEDCKLTMPSSQLNHLLKHVLLPFFTRHQASFIMEKTSFR
jgi:hypothetical protein